MDKKTRGGNEMDPKIRDSSLSVIPKVIYVTTGEEDEMQKTKPPAAEVSYAK